MVDSCSLLSLKQAIALLEAKKSLAGKSNFYTGEIPQLDQLVCALQGFDGKIIMLRHGATPYSEALHEKLAGGVSEKEINDPSALARARENLSLSKNGKRKTKQYARSREGQLLRQFARCAKVLVSPLLRTQQTAEFIATKHSKMRHRIPRTRDRLHKERADISYETRSRLNEQHLGEDFGMPSEDFGMHSKGGRDKLNDYFYVPEGGEATADFVQKVVLSLIESINEAKKENKDLVIIGHSNWILTSLAATVALTNGVVQTGDWNGKVESYKGLEISRPVDGIRTIGPLTNG